MAHPTTASAEFPFAFPVCILVERAIPVAATGQTRVDGVFFVESNGRRAIAVFTTRNLAVQYARASGSPQAQVGEFDDPLDFGHFLQQQQQAGFTHLCIDHLGHLPPFVPIHDALTYLAAAARHPR